jgi:hypothetical protein
VSFLADVMSAVSLVTREGNMIRNRAVIIAGAAALVLTAGGGAAYAASASVPDPAGVIHGCFKPTSNGSVSRWEWLIPRFRAGRTRGARRS